MLRIVSTRLSHNFVKQNNQLRVKQIASSLRTLSTSSTSSIPINSNSNNKELFTKFPNKNGFYDSKLEKDSCGVGIVAHLKRQASRQIVLDANQMLVRMSHRGGCGCEVNTGDGAGILIGMPHTYYQTQVQKSLGITLKELGSYGCGIVFTPKADVSVAAIKSIFEAQASSCGLKVLGWRSIETGM